MDVTMLDLMHKGESGAEGYNAYNRGTYGRAVVAGNRPVDFSELTVAEIQRRQALDLGTPGHFSDERLFAIGKYQVIPETLKGAIDYLGIQPDEKFTPQLQDRIFAEYLIVEKQKAVYGYVTGDERYSLYAARRQLSFEWASFPDPSKPGDLSFYGAPNAAHISNAEVTKVLTGMREEYAAKVARGVPPQEAWTAVTGISNQPSLEFRGVPYALPQERPLEHGDRGEAVRSLQTNLNRLSTGDSHGGLLRADGAFGDATQESVAAFQRTVGLDATGKADLPTLTAVHARVNAMQAEPDFEQIVRRFQSPGHRDDWTHTENGLSNYLRSDARQSNADPQRRAHAPVHGILSDGALQIGEQGPEIAKLQDSLIKLGINDHIKNPIKADGIFGPDTQRAVQAFQLWHGTEQVNGVADRRTLAAIHTQAGLAAIQRATDQAAGAPIRDFAANANLGVKTDPRSAADPREADVSPNAMEPAAATPAKEPSRMNPLASAEASQTESQHGPARLSPADQAMFAKIRAGAPPEVADETVAAAMLAAKRNGIPDAERIGPVGVANGVLWVGGTVPGFHTGLSLAERAPPMQDTLREVQAFNQQREPALQTQPQPSRTGPNPGP